MRGLKTILIVTYVVIIILLLLSLIKCDGKTNKDVQKVTDTVIVERKDTVIVRDTIREPQEPVEEKRDTIVDGKKIEIKETFEADVVMCIDCTGSMSSIINTIKSNAMNFYPDVKSRCIRQGKDVYDMRIKIIGFRDYSDGTPLEESPFFNIPEKKTALYSFLARLTAVGGGDEPEIGHDALARAFKVNWNRGRNVRQVVLLWTDASSHNMKGTGSIGASVSGLKRIWGRMNAAGKRLIIFAPKGNSWESVARSLDKAVRRDVNAGRGLSDVDYEEIIKAVSDTM